MITARYTWDTATVQPGFALHTSTQPQLKYLPLVPLFAVGYGIFKVCTEPQPMVEGGPPIAVGAVFLLGLRPLIRWQFQRAIRANPAYGQEIEWTFEPESVAVAGGESSAQFTWKALHSATVSAHGLLLYPQKNVFHWVPATAFGSAADYAIVRGYIAQSGIRMRTI